MWHRSIVVVCRPNIAMNFLSELTMAHERAEPMRCHMRIEQSQIGGMFVSLSVF